VPTNIAMTCEVSIHESHKILIISSLLDHTEAAFSPNRPNAAYFGVSLYSAVRFHLGFNKRVVISPLFPQLVRVSYTLLDLPLAQARSGVTRMSVA